MKSDYDPEFTARLAELSREDDERIRRRAEERIRDDLDLLTTERDIALDIVEEALTALCESFAKFCRLMALERGWENQP